jgi:hypothetical protein
MLEINLYARRYRCDETVWPDKQQDEIKMTQDGRQAMRWTTLKMVFWTPLILAVEIKHVGNKHPAF